MSSTNRSRKIESGWKKRKKKQRIEKLIQSQKRATGMFITKQSQVSSYFNPIFFKLVGLTF
jgi:hypothetical protein